MSEAFVPFVPKALAGSSIEPFQAMVVAGNENTAPEPPPPVTVSNASLETHDAAQPQVSLTRDGERITGIRVQCSCGKVTELQCVY